MHHVARISVMLLRAHSPCSLHCLIASLALAAFCPWPPVAAWLFAACPWLLANLLLLPLHLLVALEEAQEEVVGKGLLKVAGPGTRKSRLGSISSSTGTRKDSDLMNQFDIKVHLKNFCDLTNFVFLN